MKHFRHFIFTIFLVIFSYLFFGCQTINNLKKEFYTNPEVLPESTLFPQEIIWNEFEPGFEKTKFHIDSINVSWTAVKIDLDTEDLQIDIEPTEENLGKLFNVKNYAKKHKAIVALNTTPFDLGKTEYPVGITKFDNKEITPPKKKYCALGFMYNENNKLRACIADTQTEDILGVCPHAIGGFYTIYENNELISFAKNKRSRVGCGISDDGRYLYIMVCTPDFHLTDRNGLNYEECALIFQKLGCEKAMQFDGGHSSALVIKGKNAEAPFMQRKVPTILIFYKK